MRSLSYTVGVLSYCCNGYNSECCKRRQQDQETQLLSDPNPHPDRQRTGQPWFLVQSCSSTGMPDFQRDCMSV